MGPPRDRLAAMQQAAYFEEGDDYGVGMQDEAMDGKFCSGTKMSSYIRIYIYYILSIFIITSHTF